MGTYTGLRCKVKLKNEFIPVIEKLLETQEWSNLSHAFLDEYSTYRNADSIPFAVEQTYMPDSWETDEAFIDWKNRIEEKVWIFQCSLTNYNGTIEYFFDNVLSLIAEEAYHIEVYREDKDFSKLYKLINGKICESEKKTILYEKDWPF